MLQKINCRTFASKISYWMFLSHILQALYSTCSSVSQQLIVSQSLDSVSVEQSNNVMQCF